MNDSDSSMAANAIAHHARQHYENLNYELCRPFITMRPKLYIDGDCWCALYGENLQEGICGFGVSPYGGSDGVRQGFP